MMYKWMLLFSVILLTASCDEAEPEDRTQLPQKQEKTSAVVQGLRIENGGYRGSEYTDDDENTFTLSNIPVFITNDSTIPAHVQLNFNRAYDYPTGYEDGQFKVVPLPEEWARDQASDEEMKPMMKILTEFVDRPILNRTLNPGETIGIGIATLYPRPKADWWMVPHALIAHPSPDDLPRCTWLVEQHGRPPGLEFPFPWSCDTSRVAS